MPIRIFGSKMEGYYWDYQIGVDKMGACSTHGGNKKCILNLSVENLKRDSSVCVKTKQKRIFATM
jgi:hypothetical protein